MTRRSGVAAPRGRVRGDHICAAHAVCFQCFKAGMERVRERREAWAQRSLPYEDPPRVLTPRAVAHRQQMLEHLARLATRA
jgi:hypothetical protein